MLTLLVVVLIVAVLSLVLNAAFILHELGWFPHGKDRSRPTVQRHLMPTGNLPTIEEARRNNRDVQTQGPFTAKLRQKGHPDVYKFEDPETHLREVLHRYRERTTASRRDDVLNLANAIATSVDPNDRLDALVEEVIQATQQPVFTSPGED